MTDRSMALDTQPRNVIDRVLEVLAKNFLPTFAVLLLSACGGGGGGSDAGPAAGARTRCASP